MALLICRAKRVAQADQGPGRGHRAAQLLVYLWILVWGSPAAPTADSSPRSTRSQAGNTRTPNSPAALPWTRAGRVVCRAQPAAPSAGKAGVRWA